MNYKEILEVILFIYFIVSLSYLGYNVYYINSFYFRGFLKTVFQGIVSYGLICISVIILLFLYLGYLRIGMSPGMGDGYFEYYTIIIFCISLPLFSIFTTLLFSDVMRGLSMKSRGLDFYNRGIEIDMSISPVNKKLYKGLTIVYMVLFSIILGVFILLFQTRVDELRQQRADESRKYELQTREANQEFSSDINHYVCNLDQDFITIVDDSKVYRTSLKLGNPIETLIGYIHRNEIIFGLPKGYSPDRSFSGYLDEIKRILDICTNTQGEVLRNAYALKFIDIEMDNVEYKLRERDQRQKSSSGSGDFVCEFLVNTSVSAIVIDEAGDVFWKKNKDFYDPNVRLKSTISNNTLVFQIGYLKDNIIYIGKNNLATDKETITYKNILRSPDKTGSAILDLYNFCVNENGTILQDAYEYILDDKLVY